MSYLLHCTSVVQCRDSILKSIEKKLNSSDLNDYDLLMAASIYFNEQVCECIAFLIFFAFFFCLAIKRVQKQVLCIIFPAVHYQEALATTGCVPLHTRRIELCIKLFTKIKKPESRLRHVVPPTRSQAHGCSLRNKDRPSLITCKTERFKRSFFPAMCLYAHGM